MEKQEAFRRFSNSLLFANLDKATQKSIFDSGTVAEYQPGKSLILEGQVNEKLYVVLVGEVEVILPRGNRRMAEIRLSVMRYGEHFGEYSWLDGEPASATIRTTAETTLFSITNEAMEHLVDGNPLLALTIYRELLFTLIRRLRRSNRELDMLGKTVHENF